MFSTILIANRGEIACRVIRTARKMGIKTVAVCSEADIDAVHVRMADQYAIIGPPPSTESYLQGERILQAMKDTGAEAVHPGYGFLSENAAFAKAVDKAGFVFIGPPPEAIAAMGDKIESKKLANKAGVNTIPGHMGIIKDTRETIRVANDIGYPVMIKASAGGGGKGMRVAYNDDEAREGFQSARNEAKSSFGDDRIFIEKFIEQPRHIEIQLLADGHGNTIYLGERECSIQRRHQKVIEEAPSPFVDPKMRQQMGEQAVALAKAVGYRSAGTVELVAGADKNFYFLEMNTRLQVEHPVTELVTGLDLVEWMIRIAAGEKLPFDQNQISLNGWALEARVYAEDPTRNFLPSIGRLVKYREPEGQGIRVDSGVSEGSDISMFYDPMIAKLCSFAQNRNDAITRMQMALDEYYVRGPRHNIAFLSDLMRHPRFIAGELTTNFIAEEYRDGFHGAKITPQEHDLFIAVATFVHLRIMSQAATITGQLPGHERVIGRGWVVIEGETHTAVTAAPIEDQGYEIALKDKVFSLRSDWQLGMTHFRAMVENESLVMQVERNGPYYRLIRGGGILDVMVLTAHQAHLQKFMLSKKAADMSDYLLSPMPGLLVSVAVEEGQDIRAGDQLAVVEAMKMENVLRAERDGVVKSIEAEVGQSLEVDQPILRFS